MRKVVLLIAVFTFFFSTVAVPRILFAQAPGGVSFSSGTPEFQFQIPIGALKSLTLCEKKGETLSCPGIAQYVQAAYMFLVGFAAVLAVLAMTWGGIQWLISRGESGKIQEARKIIGNAVVGLIIALGSYAVLSVINPRFIEFSPLSIQQIKEIPLVIREIDLASLSETTSAPKVATTPSSTGPTPSATADFPTIKWLSLVPQRTATKEYGDIYADVFTYTSGPDMPWYKGPQKGAHPNRILDSHEGTHYIIGFFEKVRGIAPVSRSGTG